MSVVPSPLCRLKWAVTHVIGLHIELTILGEYDVASKTIVGTLLCSLSNTQPKQLQENQILRRMSLINLVLIPTLVSALNSTIIFL